MKVILTERAPVPAGHYSQALVHEGLVYVSGQLPIRPGAEEKHPVTIEEQAELVLSNLKAILEAAGSSLDRVLKTTVYLADIGLWERVNVVYSRVFGAHRPARAVVPTGALHHGFLIEADAVAACGKE